MIPVGRLSLNKSLQRNLQLHLKEKQDNIDWLGHIFDHAVNSPLEPFSDFPYNWDIKKSKIIIRAVGKPIVEQKATFGHTEEPAFILSVPTHNPSRRFIRRLVEKIENESFNIGPSSSTDPITRRVSIVIGLNNCSKSYDSRVYRRFCEKVEKLRNHSAKTPFSRYASLTIIPYIWEHHWVQKRGLSRHIFVHDKCFMIANSYFQHLKGSSKNLRISSQFRKSGGPKETTIPYQKIRDTILHSASTKKLISLSKAPVKYILSLDGDFSSLKASSNAPGLLESYDTIITEHRESTDEYPDIVCTGYIAPRSESNELIKKGIELDRRIRAAIPAKFVYMTEPNFAFRVNRAEDLVPSRLSWTGSTTMHTESRRLILNGISRQLFDPERFVYSSNGGIQTEIDAEWRTKTVVKYETLTSQYFFQGEVQKALRGIHQSYADPQVWASNVYASFQITVSNRMGMAITPMKGIRELFDPITVKNLLHAKQTKSQSHLTDLLNIFEFYIECLNYYSTGEYSKKVLIKYFLEQANIADKDAVNRWKNTLNVQLPLLKKHIATLKENYSAAQIEEIVGAAASTGLAIKEFYQAEIPS